LRYQRNSGQTGTGNLSLATSIESTNSIPFAGKAVTLSFYARAGANYSAASNALPVYLYGSTGTDQNILSAWAGSSTVGATTITLTTTWQRFVVTGTVASTVTQLGIQTYFSPTGTASTNDWYEITGVQIDLGTYSATTAPSFRRSGGTIQGELAACQRYYYKWVEGLGAGGVGASMGLGANYNATQMNLTCSFPVTMRANPTLVATTGSAYYKFERNGAQDDFNSLTIFHAGVSQAMLYNATEISGTAGHAGSVSTQNASASVAFSAEL
jgi:hypothetical protein